ncbi:MAG TPA: helix-turn-helix transcriptional regulator [Brevundimonas sp.]|uniref:helix-turn-helix domain-containing protein n=1 Tax=Brevundimonas sp. TaxID=1871086 RepID=UPI00261F56C7|nr:helix-turn-helix transcriptional regulator [Brevundimonas sp.]HRO33057.1 helix-turn-helix transcriptional regulator [Brevundimonas sp.]
MQLAQTFGQNVRRLRLDRGLTLEALADEVGLAYTYVGQIERGQRNPTLGVVEKIAAALGADAIDLLRPAS